MLTGREHGNDDPAFGADLGKARCGGHEIGVLGDRLDDSRIDVVGQHRNMRLG